MKIKSVGITYDLRSDFLRRGFPLEQILHMDKENTIVDLQQALLDIGYHAECIGNIYDLVEQLATGKRWDIVFNYTGGFFGRSREAQIPALLEAYQVPYVLSSPTTLCIALDKSLTKRIIQGDAIPTAAYTVVNNQADAENNPVPYPVCIKPVFGIYGMGVQKIKTEEDLWPACASLIEQFKQPVLVESYLPGRDLTVGIIGTGAEAKAIGVLEIELDLVNGADPVGYSAFNKEHGELAPRKLVRDAIAAQAADIALRAWHVLGCYDAGRVDLRLDAQGIPNFLEVNPIPGLERGDSDFPTIAELQGIAYPQFIEMIMNAAINRIAQQSK
jgi:D-alanine-D-alanine ligase